MRYFLRQCGKSLLGFVMFGAAIAGLFVLAVVFIPGAFLYFLIPGSRK